MYRGSYRKLGWLSQNIGLPPYSMSTSGVAANGPLRLTLVFAVFWPIWPPYIWPVMSRRSVPEVMVKLYHRVKTEGSVKCLKCVKVGCDVSGDT